MVFLLSSRFKGSVPNSFTGFFARNYVPSINHIIDLKKLVNIEFDFGIKLLKV